MAIKGMHEVAGELLHRSKAQKVDWKQTYRDEEFRVDFPDVSLSISFEPQGERYQLDLVNDTGAVIDTVLTVSGETEPELAPVLQEIYELAAAYVRDAALERALHYLKRA